MTEGEALWQPITLERAVELGWKPHPDGLGTVTRACDEWLMTCRDQRAYLRLTLSRMKKVFDDEWDDVIHSPANEDSPHPYDIFYDRIGMSSNDWEWMTLAAIVRDAVTAYEVYIIHAFQEVREFHWHDVDRETPAPRLGEATAGAVVLGLKVRPQPVAEIVELRNILTHQRGLLRTKKERERYSEDSEFSDRVAHLTEAKVVAILDTLNAAVRDLDPIYWAYTYGTMVAPPLLARGKGYDTTSNELS